MLSTEEHVTLPEVHIFHELGESLCKSAGASLNATDLKHAFPFSVQVRNTANLKGK